MLNNRIAIIGLGYVGLPLALAFGEKFITVGFDINKDRIKELKNSDVAISIYFLKTKLIHN